MHFILAFRSEDKDKLVKELEVKDKSKRKCKKYKNNLFVTSKTRNHQFTNSRI